MLYADEILKTVVENNLITKVTYRDASLNEANIEVDDMEGIQFPLFINVAPNKLTDNAVLDSGSITRRKQVVAFMLTQHDAETMEYTTASVKHLVRQMELLCDKLIHELNRQAVTDSNTKGIVNFQCREVYAKLDGHLFGVALTFTWPVNEQTKGCYIA